MQASTRRKTLRKNERLFERKAITRIFDDGKLFTASPIKILWVLNKKEAAVTLRAGFTAPGKIFKKAVDRNLLKRRMREAYRKNRYELENILKEKKWECHVMFIYSGRAIATYAEIESKIVVTLQHLSKNIV